MKLSVYCSYDRVAQASLPIFTARNDSEAIRMFDMGLQEAYAKQPQFFDPNDFELLCIGYYSDNPVSLTAIDVPIKLDYHFVRRENSN